MNSQQNLNLAINNHGQNSFEGITTSPIHGKSYIGVTSGIAVLQTSSNLTGSIGMNN
jgi:hypothetical protein